MNYETTRNNSHEPDDLSADERKLSVLLGNLKRVEAPKDFDFKLKARIAAASPADLRRSSFFPALRYVFPLCLVVMLSAFAALRIFAPGGDSDAPTAAVNVQPSNTTEISVPVEQEKPLVAAADANANLFVGNAAPAAPLKQSNSPVGGKQTFAVASTNGKLSGKNEIKFAAGTNRNRVSAVRVGRVIDMNPNGTGEKSPNAEQSAKLSISDVLSAIGIEVEFVGANCQVKSVRERTAARIANFQPGDIIEAIDGKKLSSGMTFSEKFTGKVFTVLRGGNQIVIDLTKR